MAVTRCMDVGVQPVRLLRPGHLSRYEIGGDAVAQQNPTTDACL